MPKPHKRSASEQVLIELVEADVETGFALVDVAKGEACRGNVEFSRKALQQAEEILADIEQRLEHLGTEQSAPFQSLLEELRRETKAAKAE